MNWLRKFLPFLPSPGTIEGFVYVADGRDDPLARAREGQIVAIEGRGPPWIVVNHTLESVVVAKWPGRLWRVRTVEAATERDQRKTGGVPLPSARYTRAISVEVLGELVPDVLFGPHGRDVATVLAKATELDRAQADALSSNRHPDVGAVCEQVWRAWMKQRGIPDSHYPELDGTLRLGSVAPGSPINEGLTVLHRIVFERATEVDRAAAIREEDDEALLLPPWSGAGRALGEAALAFGAPELAEESTRAILLQSWRRVFE